MLVATLRGSNAPDVTPAILEAVQMAKVPVRIRDVAQFVVEGSLVLSLIFQFVGTSSIRMMQTLLETARNMDMQLDFEFPGKMLEIDSVQPRRKEPSIPERMVSIMVLVRSHLPVALLQGLYGYVHEQRGKVMEVKHQLENKIGWNREFNVVGLTVCCPSNVPISRFYLNLRQLCWQHSAEVAVREFAAMNFPTTKSLVVFGLSEVLLQCSVLDELIREAGVEAPKPSKRIARTPEALSAAKLKCLKGASAECQQRLVERLPFTPGAKFICRALKDVGFRLALITNTGGLLVANAVKEILDLDYAIAPEYGVDANNCFTGEYAGDTGDLEIRKFDFLQLLADKEDIEPSDVVIVGRFMENHPEQTVNETLDNYGPQIYYHARPKNKEPNSLISILYLLGFSGFDVQALKSQFHDKASESEVYAEAFADVQMVHDMTRSRHARMGGHRYLVRIHSSENDMQRSAKLLDALLPYEKTGDLAMISSQQITIASGDAFLGLELKLYGENPNAALKDLLFEAHELKMDVDWDKKAPSSPSRTDVGGGHGRYVLTLVKKPELSVSCLQAVFRHCSDLDVDCLKLERLSQRGDLSALRMVALVPNNVEAEIRSRLLAASQDHEVDIAFQLAGIERWGRRLIAFDLDNTLIQQVTINELVRAAGVEQEALDIISAQAKSADLTFNQALEKKVLLLKGHNAEYLLKHVISNLVFTPGSRRLCRTLKRLGYKMALISGGCIQVAREVQRSLGLDYAFANELEVDLVSGEFTGYTVGPVVTPQRKRVLLSRIAEVEGCDLSQTVAVGDGQSDIPMLEAAGLGVAFCGKPQVQAVADIRVNNPDLSSVLFLLGLSEAVAIHLGRDLDKAEDAIESTSQSLGDGTPRTSMSAFVMPPSLESRLPSLPEDHQAPGQMLRELSRSHSSH